jgi:hypothetical protein
MEANMQLDRYASVMQETRHPTRTSEEYRFLSTAAALGVLADHGWFAAKVVEAHCRKPENFGYQKHLVRLRSPDHGRTEAGVIPELVLKNSHNGESALRLFGGIHEMVCSNGLVVWRELQDIERITHRGSAAEQLAAAVGYVASSIPENLATRERWRGVRLERHEQLAYAEAVIPLVFDGEKYAIAPSELLHVRHWDQREPSLWNTMNIVQEAIIRGGVRQHRADGSHIRSRAVRDVDRNVQINRDLWRIAADLERALN